MNRPFPLGLQEWLHRVCQNHRYDPSNAFSDAITAGRTGSNTWPVQLPGKNQKNTHKELTLLPNELVWEVTDLL